MKNFCTDLRKHATKIIDGEQKKRNDVIDKWRKEIISRAESLLYMQERI